MSTKNTPAMSAGRGVQAMSYEMIGGLQRCSTCGNWHNGPCPGTTTVVSSGKVPYKCPCCDGFGKRARMEPTTAGPWVWDQCVSCAGTGVVWA